MTVEETKELEFTLRVRNNRLKERRSKLGLSQPKFAEAARVGLGSYRALEAMKLHPQYVDGSWRDIALALSAFHRVDVEELFPPAVLAVGEPVIVRKVDGHDLRELMSTHDTLRLEAPDELYDRIEVGSQIVRVLATLTPREEQVIRHRFGIDGAEEMTLEEIGAKLGVNRERIRQVEAKALRKMRHPARSGTLKLFAPQGKTEAERARKKERARWEALTPSEQSEETREQDERSRREFHDRFLRDAERAMGKPLRRPKPNLDDRSREIVMRERERIQQNRTGDNDL